jgi:membrane-associated phospholipid phosphatase
MLEKSKKIIEKNLKWIIVFFCLLAFLAIAEDVFNQDIMKCDTFAYNIIVKQMRFDFLTVIMKVITNFGSAISIIIISLLSVIFIKDKKVSASVIINIILVTILNQVLKNILQRPRPDGFRLISESGYSFPSGHSMVSMAFYGLFIYLAYTKIENKNLRSIVCILLSILVVLIGFSRIYLGVHYASDVLGGFLISMSYLIVFVEIVPKLLNLKGGNKDEKIDK